MLAGGDAVLTMIPHGVGQGASFDLALNTAALPGLVQVQRLRANMSMPPAVFSVSNSAPATCWASVPSTKKTCPKSSPA